MEIYIEYFLIENILINFSLLKMIEASTKNNSSFFKMLIASIVGASASVIFVAIYTNSLLVNMLKLVSACLMLIICFKQTVKQYVVSFVLLFIYSYAFSGFISAINSNSFYNGSGFVIANRISLFSITILAIILSFVLNKVLKNIKLNFKKNKLIYKMKIYNNNQYICINGFMDTGNLLCYRNKPIILIDMDTYLKLTNKNVMDIYLNKTQEISTKTVNGINKLKLFNIEKIEIKINNKKIILKNQLVAINSNNCFKNTNYKALLTPLLL